MDRPTDRICHKHKTKTEREADDKAAFEALTCICSHKWNAHFENFNKQEWACTRCECFMFVDKTKDNSMSVYTDWMIRHIGQGGQR